MNRIISRIVAVLIGITCVSGAATAAPVTIDFTGSVDFFNPGPFTRDVPLSGQIVLDDTVIPSGPNNTYTNVITSLTLTISEPGGAVSYTNNGSGGQVSQFTSAGGDTEFVSVGFGGFAGGIFNIPAGAPVLTSFSIDFRGADLFADPTSLATGLTEADFSFSFTRYNFDNGGTNLLMVERLLDTVTFSGDRQAAAVSAPGASMLLTLGLLGLVMRRRRF